MENPLVAPALSALTDTDVLLEFRKALVAVYPILRRLECLENDTQPYDDFDTVAESLWQVIVLRSFMWRAGLKAPPTLPKYGFVGTVPTQDGFISVAPKPGVPALRFVEFIGSRAFGPEPFNAAHGITNAGSSETIPLGVSVSFSWVR